MKIKLLIDVPVDKVEGMTKGRVLEVIGMEDSDLVRGVRKSYWVMGDFGKVKIWSYECELMPEDDSKAE
jgi:hypothetical protein